MTFDSTCIFCQASGEACEVHSQSKSKKRTSKSKKPDQPSPYKPIETVGAVDFQWANEDEKPKTFSAPVEVQLSSEELVDREAVRNLWDILSPETQRQFYTEAWPQIGPRQAKRRSELRRSFSENEHRRQ